MLGYFQNEVKDEEFIDFKQFYTVIEEKMKIVCQFDDLEKSFLSKNLES